MIAMVASLPRWPQRFGKVQVVPWRMTMPPKLLPVSASPRWLPVLAGASSVLAVRRAEAGVISEMMARAMNPIIDLVQGIGEPLLIVGASTGFLFYMVGNRRQGVLLIKSSILGYLGLRFVPVLATVVNDVSSAMTAGMPHH